MESRVNILVGLRMIISIFVVICIVYLGSTGMTEGGGDRVFLEAMFFMSLASIFCLAYFRPHWLPLFRAILWVCKTLSYPQKNIMSLIYAGLFFLYGAWNFYLWLFGVR